MSFLRILSPARRTNSYRREDPTLTLHVPAYGALYMTQSVLPFGQQDAGYHSEPFSLRGWVQISVPASHGRCKCKSVKVGFRTVCRLAMGPNRGWEEDVLFQREENMVDDTGIWFEEGSTKFEFAFTLPDNFPAMDWHENAKVRHELYAVVEGVPPRAQGLKLFQSLRAASPSAGPSRGRSPAASRNRSPAPSRGRSPLPSPSPSRPPSPPIGEMSSLRLDTTSVSLVHRSDHLPQTPSYEEAATPPADQEEGWLEGTFTVKRNIRVVWNPNSTGGINSLDEKVRDTDEALGEYEVHFKAPLVSFELDPADIRWTVCCVLHSRVHFSALPPTATIFYVRVDLVQNVVLRSPRDKGPKAEDKAIRTTCRHLIAKQGKRPSRETKRPDVHAPAVWRGTESGGEDREDMVVVSKGRLPNDVDTRPSTLDGVDTPVHVSHTLLVEIIYSVWGEDAHGQPLHKPGPGDTRTVNIARNVMLPGCPNIPENVGLPEYASDPSNRLRQPNLPCPLCKIPPEDRLCTTCPFDRPSHPRHDHPPKVVGTADGTCPVCSVLLVHEGDANWKNCACAMSFNEMDRLGQELERSGGAAAVRMWREEPEGHKEEYERGRQMER